jgi:hypothetical protein
MAAACPKLFGTSLKEPDMVLDCCEAASRGRLETYIISCLVQEIQNLRETLEFYEVNLIGDVPGTAATVSLRETLTTPLGL